MHGLTLAAGVLLVGGLAAADPENVEGLRLFARRAVDGKSLYLGPWTVGRTLPSVNDLPTAELPAGEYRIVVQKTVRREPANGVLVSQGGRSILMPAEALNLKDYVFTCRISDEMCFGLRAQNGATQNSASWRMYESSGRGTDSGFTSTGS